MDNIKLAIQKLSLLKERHLPLLHEGLKVGGGKIFSVDFLAWAAISRSISNIDGFLAMVEQGNYILANSIIRLQLDTILRFFSIHLVESPHDLATEIMKGQSLRDIKDIKSNKMTDRYLCDTFAAAEKLEWIKDVYERSSGYIHLSDKHIYTLFAGAKETDVYLSVELVCGSNGNATVPEELKVETIECMQHITQLILKYVSGWVETKKIY